MRVEIQSMQQLDTLDIPSIFHLIEYNSDDYLT